MRKKMYIVALYKRERGKDNGEIRSANKLKASEIDRPGFTIIKHACLGKPAPSFPTRVAERNMVY